MQLTRLDIKGFKSFGDKVTINFNEGVTAIVGPNGCGKSNVVDAIRWVLGEQSTRALRSEKMENIIFNGTKNRKAAQLAEVSLSFDNTKNVLPTAYAQITITRKLYRNGDSEYRLNDVQCRLKDITDLFLDTGVGSDSYSIIELKMVDEIIANKENSRRSLFEEASGISKYKVRKRQTLNKLKDTRLDLERVDDLLFEIEKNLKTLENQAKKAERYYKLKAEYKTLSVALATHRIAFFRTDLDTLEQEELKHLEARSSQSTGIDSLEAKVQKLKLDSIHFEKNLSIQQKATNEYVFKIRNYESDKKVKNEQLRFLQEKEQRISTELEKDKNQLNHVKYNLKRLHEETLLEQEQFNRLKLQLTELQKQLDQLREQQQIEKNKSEDAIKRTNTLQNEVYQAQKEIDILHIQKEALKQEQSRSTEDAATKTLELKSFRHALEELQLNIENREKYLTDLVAQENKLQADLAHTEQVRLKEKELLALSNRHKDAKQNEYNLTKSLVDSLEGFPESIRFLKKNSEWSKNALLLSDILFCKDDYRVAIEHYLEPFMNHYVVQHYENALQGLQLLKESSRGRAQFFILDRVAESPKTLSTDDALIPALEVVECEAKYQNLCNLLLKDVFLSKAPLTKIPQGDSKIILDAQGSFVQKDYILSGGSVGLFEGKRIGRAKNLELLNKDIKNLEQEIQRSNKVILQSEESIHILRENSKKTEIQQLQQQVHQLKNEEISLQTRFDQYQEFINSSKNRQSDILLKIQGIENKLDTQLPSLLSLQKQQQEAHLLLAEQQEIYQAIAEEVNTAASEYNQLNIKFHQQQNKCNSLDKDLEYKEVQEESLNKRMMTYEQELSTVKTEMQEALSHTDINDEQLLEMYAQKEAMEKAVEEAEQLYYKTKGDINDLENQLNELRKLREQTDLLLSESKDKKNQLKIDLNALKERLAVEFEIDINDLLEQPAALNDTEFELRQRVEKLKRQLDDFGAINSMAMEAYQEMHERLTFIQSQKQDLLEAEKDLLKTIQEIDDTARQKFMEAFTLAREHFIHVFRSLFNDEDSCDLILSDPQNPLEADIEIIARPKGKRPLSINQLSGGEKTLTATALLFSLYLLKPAPFCIFDEVDAPLDDTNIDKFNKIIRKFSNQSQFIIVSHNKRTIASTDIIYGVTMVEQGISRVVAVDLREVA